MRIDLGLLFLALFAIMIAVLAVWDAVDNAREAERLKKRLTRYEHAMQYQDRVLDECVTRAEFRQKNKKTQLRVKVLDGKLCGFMDKEQ